MTDFREKPVLTLYSQPFLYPIDGKLCPEGRGTLLIFSLKLGSLIIHYPWGLTLERGAMASIGRGLQPTLALGPVKLFPPNAALFYGNRILE